VAAALSGPHVGAASRRRGERGLLRGLLLAVVGVLLLLLVIGGWSYRRMTSAPDLGAPPQGPAHGTTESALAVYAATQLVGLLSPVGSRHATVTFSEQDLTALAKERASSDFADPQVRVRDGEVVVSGDASVAGLGVVGVGRLGLHLVAGSDGQPDITVSLDEIDAGQLTLPSFLRDAIAQQVQSQVQLDNVLEADSRLRLLRPELECVAAAPAGVVLGFHAPFEPADRASCGA
jgi:hypothetical protein